MAKKASKKAGKKASRKTPGKAARKTTAKSVAKTQRKPARKKVSKAASSVLCIDLNSEQGIRDVAELHQRLIAVIGHEAGITIDASAIERVDTAILQVLTAFIIERKKQGKTVLWKQPSDTFCQAARLVDLDGHLDLPPD